MTFASELVTSHGAVQRDGVDKFYNALHVGKVYLVCKGQIRPANKKWSRVPNAQYELSLGAETEIEEVCRERCCPNIAINIWLRAWV